MRCSLTPSLRQRRFCRTLNGGFCFGSTFELLARQKTHAFHPLSSRDWPACDGFVCGSHSVTMSAGGVDVQCGWNLMLFEFRGQSQRTVNGHWIIEGVSKEYRRSILRCSSFAFVVTLSLSLCGSFVSTIVFFVAWSSPSAVVRSSRFVSRLQSSSFRVCVRELRIGSCIVSVSVRYLVGHVGDLFRFVIVCAYVFVSSVVRSRALGSCS